MNQEDDQCRIHLIKCFSAQCVHPFLAKLVHCEAFKTSSGQHPATTKSYDKCCAKRQISNKVYTLKLQVLGVARSDFRFTVQHSTIDALDNAAKSPMW